MAADAVSSLGQCISGESWTPWRDHGNKQRSGECDPLRQAEKTV